jgi:hypothetical protein
MSEHSAVAVFDSVSRARAALEELSQRGIPRDRATVVANELESKQELHSLVTGTDQNVTGGAKGAVTGAVVGLVLGLVLMGMASVLPLGGQFTLPILAGGVMGLVLAGIIFGGLVGTMLGRGVKLARMEPYDEQVRAGKSLVIAHGSHDQMTQAQKILRAAGAINARVHHHVTAPLDTTEAV